MQCACAVLHCHLWPVRLYNIFPHNLINGTIFGERLIENQKCLLIFSTTFVWNISCSKKIWATYYKCSWVFKRNRWPHGLRCRSAAAQVLRLWVRIPPVAGMFSVMSAVCCQVEVSARGWSLVQGSYQLWCFVVCGRETSRMSSWPTLGRSPTRNNNNNNNNMGVYVKFPLLAYFNRV